ncbi:Amf1p [Apiospora sp. TS-2023a]
MVSAGGILVVMDWVACGWACFGIWILYVTHLLKGITTMLLAAYIWPVVIAGALTPGATGHLPRPCVRSGPRCSC